MHSDKYLNNVASTYRFPPVTAVNDVCVCVLSRPRCAVRFVVALSLSPVRRSTVAAAPRAAVGLPADVYARNVLCFYVDATYMAAVRLMVTIIYVNFRSQCLFSWSL